MERQAVAERIRSERTRAGITQAEAAKRAGMPAPQWQRYESGLRTPTAENWAAVAEALGLPLESLLLPEGWVALPVPVLRPETLVSMRTPEGFEAVYVLLCKRLREAMLLAEPLTPVPPGRRRRSREDVILKGHKPAGGAPKKRAGG